MTSIRQIPYDDIELFLLTNNIDLSSDVNVNYNIAKRLVKNSKTKFEISSVVEWMIAHNLIVLKANIPTYRKSDILEMSDQEIKKLARSLTMKSNNIDHILNILRYLGKLNEYTNIFSGNPFNKFSENTDILYETLKDSDIDDIINFCVSSNKINKSCTSSKIVSLIRYKLQEFNNIDLSKFTLKELILFSKIVKFNEYATIYYDAVIMELNKIKYNFMEVDKIGNIIQFDYKFFIITVTGNCYIWDETTKELIKINNVHNIIQVAEYHDIIWFLTSTGEVYLSSPLDIISDNVIDIDSNVINYKIKNLHNIVKLRNFLLLVAVDEDGKNYYLSTVNEGNYKKLVITTLK